MIDSKFLELEDFPFRKEWEIKGKKTILKIFSDFVGGPAYKKIIVAVEVRSSFSVQISYEGFHFENILDAAIKGETLISLIENFEKDAPVRLNKRWEKEFIIALFKAIHLRTRETSNADLSERSLEMAILEISKMRSNPITW